MAEQQEGAQFSWNPTLDGMPEELIISVFYYCPTIDLIRLSMASTKFFRLVKSPRLELANDLYDLAVDETNRLDSVASMKILNTLLYIFPNYYKGWRKRNDCWLQLNDPLLALEDLIKANKVCDDPVYAKLIQSEFYSLQKEYDKVLQVIEEAFALAPEDPVVLHHRAYAYGLVVPDGEEQAKAHEKEIELYKEILNMPYKRQLMIHNNLAYCYFQIEQDDLAFEHYDKAIALCPHFVKAYINKATLHFERSEFDEVLKDCDTILSINPNFSEAYGWKASAHLGLENLPEGLKFMTIAHARTMHDPFFAFLYYTLMIKLGHIEKVLSDIAQEMKHYIDEMNKLIVQLAELKQRREDDGYNHLRIMAVQRKKNTYRKLVRICRQKRGEVFLLDGQLDNARAELRELREIYRVGDLDNGSGEPSTTKRLLLMELMLDKVIGPDNSVLRAEAIEFSHKLLHMSMPLDIDAQEFLNNVLTQLPHVDFTEIELKYLVLVFDYKSRYIDPFFPTEFTYAAEDIHYFTTFWSEPYRASSSLQDLMYSYRY